MLYRLTLVASLSFALLAPRIGAAQDDDFEDLDSTDKSKKTKKEKRRDRKSVRAQLENEVIREVVRGFYFRTGVGSGMYFGRYGNVPGFGSVLRAVVVTPLTFGQDFVDKERTSMAWEISVTQGVYNGMTFETLDALDLPPNRLIQGDTRTFSFTAAYEYSAYPTRRLGIGPRLGGGVMVAPLLMDRQAYDRDVVGDAWSGAQSAAHTRPHPLGFLGFHLEYYTKLSHFSIGADIDAIYQLDFDVNVVGVGWLKYTL